MSAQGGLRIKSALGGFECLPANIAGDDIHIPATAVAVHHFAHRHADAVGFFPGGATGAQDAKAAGMFRLALFHFRQNHTSQRLQGCRVSKETGLAIQQMLCEKFALRTGRFAAAPAAGQPRRWVGSAALQTRPGSVSRSWYRAARRGGAPGPGAVRRVPARQRPRLPEACASQHSAV